ncbi:hypothetical protein ACFWWB_34995 [Streptomyces sp. NPDC058690]|uniref:hypothetical protein n=1 Tax=Streptomyces sp. NPDC058690 TaxID=3346600 RepID=UPI00366122BC
MTFMPMTITRPLPPEHSNFPPEHPERLSRETERPRPLAFQLPFVAWSARWGAGDLGDEEIEPFLLADR